MSFAAEILQQQIADLTAANERLEKINPAIRPKPQTLMEARIASAKRMRERMENGDMDVNEFRIQMEVIGGPANLEARERPQKDKKMAKTLYTKAEHKAELQAAVRTAKDSAKADNLRKNVKASPGARAHMRGVRALGPEQRMSDWARDNGKYEGHAVATDFDWDAYWTRKTEDVLGIRFNRPNGYGQSEARLVTALGEDVSSGPGAGAAIVGQIWGHDVMDLIRAKTFLHRLNVTTLPLPGQIYNAPIFQADVQPTYVGSDGNANPLAIDTTPNLGTLTFTAGSFGDISNVSFAVLEDAVTNGGVNAIIQNSISNKYARLLDQVALYGQIGSAGNPGIVNESGLLVQQMVAGGGTGATPTTWAEVSKATAQVRAQGAEPTGMVMHPNTWAQYAQLQDTLHQPLRRTPDIENLPLIDSGLLNYSTETQGSDTTCSSLFVGDWSYVTIGMRTDGVQVSVLNQRFAEFLEVGYLSRIRFSVRTFWPTKALCQLKGIKP